MSFLTHQANVGAAANYDYGTSLAVTLTAAVPAGRIVVVRSMTRCEAHPADTTDGATSYHPTIADSKANSWTKLGEASRGSRSFQPGTTVAAFYAVLTHALAIGDTITVTFDASRRGRQVTVEHYSAEEDGSTIAVAQVALANGQGTPVTGTISPASADDHTYLGAGATSKRDSGGVTPDATWTTDRAPTILDHGFDDSGTIFGQYRPMFSASETWTPTGFDGSQRWAMVIAALTVTPPAATPAAGTREYQEDFETSTHQVDEASTTRRPDAVTRSMLLASCDGPVAIDDASQGIESYRWQVRTTDGFTVQVRRSTAGNGDWGSWSDLFTVTGSEPIEELDVAFNVDGRIVVAMQRPNGTSGVDRVNLYRWDPGIGVNAYTQKGVVDGRSPRICNDLFPFIATAPHICPPEVDVQLFAMVSGVGLERRQESDDWDVSYPTVVPYHSGRRVEEVCKTTDRRVSVLVSRRTTSTGRYVLERADSVQYTDALLRRPSFVNWSSPALDLMQSGSEAWYNPGGTPTTQTWNLRVYIPQDVDAIQVAAIGSFPTGIEPVFDLDEQEATGGFSAGAIHDFTFDVTHGAGTMSHKAFRVRSRKTILGVTCYSPWRYTVIPAAWVSPPSVTPNDHGVNCNHDFVCQISPRMEWARHGLVEGIRENLTAAPCATEAQFSIADTNPGGSLMDYWWVGGELNTGTGLWIYRYSIRRRPWEAVSFVDEDGVLHNGVVLGAVIDGSSGAATTTAFFWPSYRFPTQFPDDSGVFPPIGISPDVIASA